MTPHRGVITIRSRDIGKHMGQGEYHGHCGKIEKSHQNALTFFPKCILRSAYCLHLSWPLVQNTEIECKKEG
jgi:hypothetical protein